MLLRIVFGLFLIAHGLIYSLYFVPNLDQKWPFVLTKGPFGSFAWTTIALKIMLISGIIAFVVSGAIIIFWPDSTVIWHATLASGAIMTTIVQVCCWNNQLILGLIINITVLWFVLFSNWSG